MKLLFMTLVCVLFGLGGATMIEQSQSLPRYYSPAQYALDAETLNNSAVDLIGTDADTATITQQFFALRAEHLTEKHIMFDRGIGLLLLAMSTWIVAAILWRADKKTIDSLLSPSKSTLFALLNLAIVSLFASSLSVLVRFARGDYPWWSDVVGTTLFGAAVLFLLIVGPANAIGALAAKRYRPHRAMKVQYAEMFQAFGRWPFIQIALALALTWLAIYCFVTGDYGLVPFIVFSYALLGLYTGGMTPSPQGSTHQKRGAAHAQPPKSSSRSSS